MRTLDLEREASEAGAGLVLDVPAALKTSANLTWLGRMVNEHASAAVFEGLAGQIVAAGLDESLREECLVFAEEERRHGAMCGAVVVAAGGRALATVPEPEPFPRHLDTTPLVALARNLVSIACMAETVAVALIGEERDAMPAGPLHDLLTRIWADEVGHARFGWRVLPTLVARLSPDERRDLEDYLPVAFEHLERHELEHLPLAAHPKAGGEAFGLCSGRDARDLFYATVAQAILPGLEQAGLAATQAWSKRQEHRPAA